MAKRKPEETSKNSQYEIELVHIGKKYGDFTAVRDSSFGIRHGEFFSLLGPSGCGKTTTLRMISGLEDPSCGRIYLAGEDVTYTPPHLRNVNTVFQDYALFPHMNIYKNIYFPLKMKNIGLKEADPMITDILRLVDMQGFEKRLPQQLSGGQRQRIALARSLVNRPRALLLDEPLGALDFKLRTSMQTVLKDIQKNVDITFIYVTHDQTEAITMSDRICVMKDGMIHQIGSPTEIYNRPATRFVAGFIGEMNFMYGTVKSVEGEYLYVRINGTVVKVKNINGFKPEDKVCVGIRPERIFVEQQKGQEYLNEISGRVHRVVFRGNDFDITLSIGENTIRYAEPTIYYKTRNIGDMITLYFNPDDAVVYLDDKQECAKGEDYEAKDNI
jgi:spermidine/putrescine transport system ATP-binding protein